MRTALLLTTLALTSACGPGAGARCSTPSAIECAGSTTVLTCEGGQWVGHPCPGCSGQTCDWKGAQVGAPCPRFAATYGTCNYDGRLIGCYWSDFTDAGTFVESACPACVAGKSLEELGRCSGGRCSCQ
ncbi:MAG: hypothetical protein IT380_17725 [Myxococcales bacterium]|nr:hypothetical protein [Myxococcales bacterium]